MDIRIGSTEDRSGGSIRRDQVQIQHCDCLVLIVTEAGSQVGCQSVSPSVRGGPRGCGVKA